MPALNLEGLIQLVSSLAGIIALVFYVGLVLWAYKDARRRIDDPILVATAVVAAIVLPIIGVLVYMLVRPPEYLEDVRERELEMRAIERELSRQERCPTCRSYIEHDYLTCPICLTKLREPCAGCNRPVDPRWQMCPYCETEVRHSRSTSPSQPGRGRKRSRPARPPRSGSDETPAPRKRSSGSPRKKSDQGDGRKRSGGKDDSSSDSQGDPEATAALVMEPIGPQGPSSSQ